MESNAMITVLKTPNTAKLLKMLERENIPVKDLGDKVEADVCHYRNCSDDWELKIGGREYSAYHPFYELLFEEIIRLVNVDTVISLPASFSRYGFVDEDIPSFDDEDEYEYQFRSRIKDYLVDALKTVPTLLLLEVVALRQEMTCAEAHQLSSEASMTAT